MANKIVGTSGDDVLKGTKGKDIIKGKGGDDVLIGKGGNDALSGGKGNDLLKGGGGKDELKGGKGNDDLKGGPGKDLLFGGKDGDHLWGGSKADIFKFTDGDGGVGNFGPGFDDVVFDYNDSKDIFDIPNLGGWTVIDDNDPVGGAGAYVLFGIGITGSFFVSNYSLAQADAGDFI